jgi:hypothetical protein
MKKGAITTLIGVALVLALSLTATPTYASDGLYQGHWCPKPLCCCPSCCDCYCGDVTFNPNPCTYDELLSDMRDHDAYYGEDVYNVYFTASVADPEIDVLELDQTGSYFIVMDKSYLQDWVVAGCP